MRAPEFWQRRGIVPALLSPAAAVYGMVQRRKFRRVFSQRISIPVICIGNAVAGGAGKTPVAIAIARQLQSDGKEVAFLLRGYGGSEKGPLRVNPLKHSHRQVGDEALLLAQTASTYVARDRVAGARMAEADGTDVIIMDDGFQNPSLHKDLSFLVIDGAYGIGNGKLLPAGPLRERLNDAAGRAQAVILIGDDATGICQQLPAALPVIPVSLQTEAPANAKPVFAFAGIGRPEKFFRSLVETEYDVIGVKAFADHHSYTIKELDRLLNEAKRYQAVPVTTTKDWVRLPVAYRKTVAAIEADALFSDVSQVKDIMRKTGIVNV